MMGTGTEMEEKKWANKVAEDLDRRLPQSYRVEAGKRLIYANEIEGYDDGETKYKKMRYETDILVSEIKNQTWHPRIVIETKVRSITTHDAIVYSQKAESHKNVHPYLRYGIFIGNAGKETLPGRLFRHGINFDFMLSWKEYTPKKGEWETFVDIIKKEIKASQKLEEIIYDSKNPKRKKYFALHKPLVMKS